jgi:16S rRNA (guanine527-N7)-methyltransferase
MDAPRIVELLEPFLGPLDQGPETQDLISNISTYIDILLRWNARMNLTAIRDPEQIVTRHFGESLFAARHLFPKERGRAALQGRVTVKEDDGASAPEAVTVADLGSGAGFPGVPIKLWAPHISLTLIESNQKKSVFLREVTRALTLTGINIQNARAESLPPSSFNVITLRAVERFETILPTAASLVAPNGRLVVLVGPAQLKHAQSLPHFESAHPIAVPLSRSRFLLLMRRTT